VLINCQHSRLGAKGPPLVGEEVRKRVGTQEVDGMTALFPSMHVAFKFVKTPNKGERQKRD